MPVDCLPVYNEVGASPMEPNYDIRVRADVCLQTFEIENVHLYDTVQGAPITYSTLNDRDRVSIQMWMRDVAENLERDLKDDDSG